MSDAITEPLGIKAYRYLSRFTGPLVQFGLNQRLSAGKEDAERMTERQGKPGLQRPEGQLIWIHGASVGESLSVLPLVQRMAELKPELSFLVTTGTVTSAKLMAERLPEKAIHQFIPIDHPDYVQTFIAHWQPDAAIFVESEFWPNLILTAREQIPFIALVNGRVSPKSFESWSRRKKTIHYLLSKFDFIVAQDSKNADRLETLSRRTVASFGNLKNAAQPLPADEQDLATLVDSIQSRPVWLAASSHPGEEVSIIAAHKILATEFPNLLTLLAPRHPNRGQEIGTLIEAEGLRPQLRSQSPHIDENTDIYIADTLGELGLFYRLSSVAFVGGSLTEKGGHNPLEPARLGCAILHGPYTFNFVETYQVMRKGGGAALVRNERELATAIRRLLRDEKTRLAMATAARNAAEASAEEALSTVAAILVERLGDTPLAA